MFYGDAFAADKIEAEIYGVDLNNNSKNVIIFN